MSPTLHCPVKGAECAIHQLKPGKGAFTGPFMDYKVHPSTEGTLCTVDNTGQHVEAGEGIWLALACTPRVYRNGTWTTRESQPGSVLKPAPKDAQEGVRPPRARLWEKHQRTRRGAAQEGRKYTVCIKELRWELLGRGVPKQPTRAPMRRSRLRISTRPGSAKHMAAQGTALLSLLPRLSPFLEL